jgi:YHS domain-containing protein
MEGLITLLLFAGLFYGLMRFTCGADLIHGGHAGIAHGKDPRDFDPVCGRAVETRAEFGMMYHGKLYRFCSRECLDTFEAEPEKYLNPPGQDQNLEEYHGPRRRPG